MNKKLLIDTIKKVIEVHKEVLFAYLYGSVLYHEELNGSDIDIAVYLIEMNVKNYLIKEEEIIKDLVVNLHTDRVDLRILNSSPFLIQYNIIKEGIPIYVRDEQKRLEFEDRVMNRFFELKPFLDEYKEALSLRIKTG